MNLRLVSMRSYLPQKGRFVWILLDEVVFVESWFHIQRSHCSGRDQFVGFRVDSDSCAGESVYVDVTTNVGLSPKNCGIGSSVLFDYFVLDLRPRVQPIKFDTRKIDGSVVKRFWSARVIVCTTTTAYGAVAIKIAAAYCTQSVDCHLTQTREL